MKATKQEFMNMVIGLILIVVFVILPIYLLHIYMWIPNLNH